MRRAIEIYIAMAGLLGVCAVYAGIVSLRWPLVGDATLMHYVVFLISRGWVPYKDIVDINFPGAYFFEFIPMHLLGWGAAAWRVYDILLCLLASYCLSVITKSKGRLLGVACGCFFFLIHLQDGIAQGGQRDLLIAVLLLCSYASLFSAQRNIAELFSLFFSGLFMGSTLTIKPTPLPLCIFLIFAAAATSPRTKGSRWRCAGVAALGVALPCAVAVFWLWRRGAVGAFVATSLTLTRMHAELGRRPFAHLVSLAISPLAILFVLWVAVLLLHRPRLDRERFELLVGVVLTATAFVMQGKGHPYQRYPLLALLLPLMGMDLVSAVESVKRSSQILAIAAVAFACLVLGPKAAWRVRSYRPETPFRSALEARLRPFGAELEGNVQCLDTFGGCIDTLYEMRLVQSTGYLYDCYLFASDASGEQARYRAGFLAEFERTRPKVVVLTDQFCFGETGGFSKLGRWPQLDGELAERYERGAEWHGSAAMRWWSHDEVPTSFRIYVRRE